MRAPRSLVCCVALLLALSALSACGGGGHAARSPATPASSNAASSGYVTPPADPVSEPNAVVVRVAGHPITKATFVHALSGAVKSAQPIYRGEGSNAVAPQPPDFAACVKHLQAVAPTGQSGSKPTVAELRGKCAQQYQTLQPEALNQLILQQWQIGGAQEDGIHVSDGELQAALSKAKAGQTQAQAEQELAISGRTWADYALETKASLYVEGIRRLLRGRVEHLTQAQIAAYYAGHKSLFATPERRDLQIVRAGSRPEALKLKSELAAGRSFASVARKLTQAHQPIYSKEGFVSEYKPGEYREPPLDHAIFAARPNVLSGPVGISLGYYVFKVTHTYPAHQETLAQAEPTIKRQLPEGRYKEAFYAYAKRWREIWRAKTDCQPGYVVPKCRQSKLTPAVLAAEDPYALN